MEAGAPPDAGGDRGEDGDRKQPPLHSASGSPAWPVRAGRWRDGPRLLPVCERASQVWNRYLENRRETRPIRREDGRPYPITGAVISLPALHGREIGASAFAAAPAAAPIPFEHVSGSNRYLKARRRDVPDEVRDGTGKINSLI